jgi:undecaprenyl-diphosphatase
VGHLSYLEATVVGAFQGVTELVPISSLGHSVLLPALVGGKWAKDLAVSAPESPYLAFIVGLHVATALALLVYFWRDWVRILHGLGTSIWHRRATEPNERLAWLLILGTIPVGITGLLLEHTFRTTLGRPMPAAAFLFANGLVLALGERLRLRQQPPETEYDDEPDAVLADRPLWRVPEPDHDGAAIDRRLAALTYRRGTAIGTAQVLALLPGISRSGVTMVAGLARGLSHEDAARFSFLLATPVILAAGVLKVPDLTGPLGAGIRGPVLAGSLAAFVAAYVAVRFLTRYFQSGTLRPFAWYCLVAGAGSFVWLAIR